MHVGVDRSLPLHGWTVLSLRPRGQHGGLRAAAARLGARTLALSPCRIEPLDDVGARKALGLALEADLILFTSPNAVRSAVDLQGISPRRAQRVLAVGSGTLVTLRRLGVAAQAPARMDSEGLLAMPALLAARGRTVGLVTGAGGRNLLAPGLRRRGAVLLRAETYRRAPVTLPARTQSALAAALASPAQVLLVLSSDEALKGVLGQLHPSLRAQLHGIAVVAASARLAGAAKEAGFARVATATSARPAALLRAAAHAFV